MHVATRSFQPQVSALESRATPSATAVAAAGKLTVTADNAGSTMYVTDDGKHKRSIKEIAQAFCLTYGAEGKKE